MKSYSKIIIAMLIFGSIGLFVQAIPLSSQEIVAVRTLLGSAFLLCLLALEKQKIHWLTLKKNLPLLILSGAAMGCNWLFLFEAYRYTSISIATLVYYCAPLLVLLLSSILLKEALTPYKLMGVFMAIVGMFLVNGGGISGINPTNGLLYGFLAALFYAALMICNKWIKGLNSLHITLVQLIVAAIILLPYALFTHQGSWQIPQGTAILAILAIGIVHTSIACYLYFSAMQELPAQSVALCSYIDPFSALLFSAFFLGERLSLIQMIGAVFILGGACFGELYRPKKPHHKQEESFSAVIHD